jgi:hypothetical protein
MSITKSKWFSWGALISALFVMAWGVILICGTHQQTEYILYPLIPLGGIGAYLAYLIENKLRKDQ